MRSSSAGWAASAARGRCCTRCTTSTRCRSESWPAPPPACRLSSRSSRQRSSRPTRTRSRRQPAPIASSSPADASCPSFR
ncbi:MAG: hypothetical protein IPI27_07050 [Betaproteobacteria bacterium]|nr:hypothetical protein [Betaproteobacteria bacterium]